jgi:hypothetical protein
MAGKGATPKGEFVGKSAVFSTRIRPDLRIKLEKAAKDSGRSVSQEVEFRLRRSFTDDEKIAEMFFDRTTFALMRMVALAIHLNPLPENNRSWLEDPEQFESAIAAALNVLEAVRPGKVDYNVPLSDFLQSRGQSIAFQVWRKIRQADPALPLGKGTRADHRNAIIKLDLKSVGDAGEQAQSKTDEEDEP